MATAEDIKERKKLGQVIKEGRAGWGCSSAAVCVPSCKWLWV